MTDFLELPGNEYYTLEAIIDEKKKISLHVEMSTAIKRVHKFIQDDVPSDRITLTQITIHPQEMKAKGIPWSVIATELIKGIKK